MEALGINFNLYYNCKNLTLSLLAFSYSQDPITIQYLAYLKEYQLTWYRLSGNKVAVLQEEHEAILKKREEMNPKITWEECKSMKFTNQVIYLSCIYLYSVGIRYDYAFLVNVQFCPYFIKKKGSYRSTRSQEHTGWAIWCASDKPNRLLFPTAPN